MNDVHCKQIDVALEVLIHTRPEPSDGTTDIRAKAIKILGNFMDYVPPTEPAPVPQEVKPPTPYSRRKK